MKIPRLLYGIRPEVKKRMQPLVKALRSGATVGDLDFGPMMDTADDPNPNALISLNPGRQLSTRVNGFHCYAYLYALMDAVSKKKIEYRIFEDAFIWSLTPTWAFVGTLGEAGGIFFLKMPRDAFTREPPPRILRGRPEWYAPYLKATLRHWSELTKEGPRFASSVVSEPKEFTRVAFNIGGVLGDCGIVSKAEELDSPAKVLAAVHRALEVLDN